MQSVDSSAQADQWVIELMAEVGADLTVATEVNHYLSFPHKEAAGRAEAQLRARGFVTEVGAPMPGRREWWLFASHSAVLSESSAGLLRAAMERLAAAHGGKYDGWEALVVPGADRS